MTNVLREVRRGETLVVPREETALPRGASTSLQPYVAHGDALEWLEGRREKADLAVIDPPYFGIVNAAWDRQWSSAADYRDWLVSVLAEVADRLSDRGSVLMFGGLGRHGCHPLFEVLAAAERFLTFRNWITWQKRRAYGKQYDYLYCREEILWLSKSPDRTACTFNVPLLNVRRGYQGWDNRYPAKSDFKRVSNVWHDIPELMRPERTAQKPVPLLDRIIQTHSNEGDLVIDCFAGWGTTGVSALQRGRRFAGCDADEEAAAAASARCKAAAEGVAVAKEAR